MNTPISPELSKEINENASLYASVQYGDPAKMQGQREIEAFDNGVEDYIAGATAYAPYKHQCEELERWKEEAILVLSPLLDYGQSEEAEIPLGASITTTILQRAKQFQQAKKALEEREKLLDEIIKLADHVYLIYIKDLIRSTREEWKEEGKEGGV